MLVLVLRFFAAVGQRSVGRQLRETLSLFIGCSSVKWLLGRSRNADKFRRRVLCSLVGECIDPCLQRHKVNSFENNFLVRVLVTLPLFVERECALSVAH